MPDRKGFPTLFIFDYLCK